MEMSQREHRVIFLNCYNLSFDFCYRLRHASLRWLLICSTSWITLSLMYCLPFWYEDHNICLIMQINFHGKRFLWYLTSRILPCSTVWDIQMWKVHGKKWFAARQWHYKKFEFAEVVTLVWIGLRIDWYTYVESFTAALGYSEKFRCHSTIHVLRCK